MASFPFTEFREGFRFIPRSGIALNASVSGTEDVRDLYGTRKSGTFTGPLKHLTAANLATLISHYEGDYANEFDFVDPITGNTYTVIYGDPGITQPIKVAADLYDVSVNLERHKLTSTSDLLLMESGDSLLMENADTIELESS